MCQKICGGNRGPKLSPTHKEIICSWVDKNCILTLNQIKQRISETFEMDISISTIDRCLKNFHFTLKRLTLLPVARNCEKTIQIRKEYAEKFSILENEISPNNLVFLDEVGFSISSKPKKDDPELAQ